MCAKYSVVRKKDDKHDWYEAIFIKVTVYVLWHCWLGGRKGIRPVKNGGWRSWAQINPDGVAPSWMVSVSATVNLPLHNKVQKFSSGTGSSGWSRKNGRKMVVVWWWCGIWKATWVKYFWTMVYKELEMWANAQRDGRPAEYRWHPLFNAAKSSWRSLLECRAVTLPRRETSWNYLGCPKLTKWS